MRKIETLARAAWLSGEPFVQSNTVVQRETDGRTFLYLHGNRIAVKNADGSVLVSFAGWGTATTRSRLRNVVGADVYQRAHNQYVNDRLVEDLSTWVQL